MTRKGGRITVTVKSVPFADDPDGAEAFYAATGRLLMMWGRFENHLDHVLLQIANLPEAQALAGLNPREMPVAMGRKATMWKLAFRTVPALASWRDEALQFMADAMDDARSRAVVVHSNWQGFTSTEPLTVKMVQWKHEGPKIIVSTYFMEIGQIAKIASQVDQLNSRLLVFGTCVSSLLWRNEARDKS